MAARARSLKNIFEGASKAFGEFAGKKSAKSMAGDISKKTYQGPAHILKGGPTIDSDIIIGRGSAEKLVGSPTRILDSAGSPYRKEIKYYADGTIGATYHGNRP